MLPAPGTIGQIRIGNTNFCLSETWGGWTTLLPCRQATRWWGLNGTVQTDYTIETVGRRGGHTGHCLTVRTLGIAGPWSPRVEKCTTVHPDKESQLWSPNPHG